MQLLFSGAIPGAADERGVRAVLGVLDTETGRIAHRCDYAPPTASRPAGRKVQFTGFSHDGSRLLVCCFDEVLVFEDWPPREPSGRITHAGFNDLHHCLPWRGGVAVANTGLETVDLVSLDGELLERWDLLEGLPGARSIDPGCDYRRIPDTKPHLRHVNHLFQADGELWATQLRSANARCLGVPGRELALDAGLPHDGCDVHGELAFTTTEGRLIFANAAAQQVERVVDLVPLTAGLDQLGWCRGLCADPENPQRVFVAFSLLRRSAWGEFGSWIRWGHAPPPSRIARYDLAAGRLIDTWRVGEDRGWVIFQIEVLPPALQV